MKKNRKVCLRAFINGNLGDDLFIDTICSRYPEVEFYLCGARRFKKYFTNLSNLHYVVIDILPMRIINKISNLGHHKFNVYQYVFNCISKYCDINILISGSFFIEWTSEQKYWDRYYKNEKKYYLREPYLIGCNFGPYKSEEYLRKHSEYFKLVKQISFRDYSSTELFKDFENVTYAPDIIFTYPVMRNVINQQKSIVVSVMTKDQDNILNVEYISKMSELCDFFSDKGYDIKLVAFCPSQFDDLVCDEILTNCKTTNKIQKVVYNGNNRKEIIDEFSNSGCVIATRYHAMILGLKFNKFVYPIVYSTKMSNVMRDIGFIGDSIPYDNISQLNVSGLYTSLLSENTTQIKNIDAVVSEASKHFKQLDEIFTQ